MSQRRKLANQLNSSLRGKDTVRLLKLWRRKLASLGLKACGVKASFGPNAWMFPTPAAIAAPL
jgi:hypothetical protein